MLVQNTGLFNFKDAIVDTVVSNTLIAGGNEVFVDNWGFGMLSTESGNSSFINGQPIISMNRTSSLLAETGYVNSNYFTRRRPKYHDLGTAQIMDVKDMGAKGEALRTTARSSTQFFRPRLTSAPSCIFLLGYM